MKWNELFKKGLEVKDIDDFVEKFWQTSKLEGAKILDLGCGTGRHTLFFAERGLKVFALDNSKSALEILDKKLQDKPYKNLVTLVKSDISQIPYPENFFDVIISTRVLHHGYVKQIIERFAEIERVLKNKGFLIISVISANDRRAKTGKQVEPNTILNMEDTFDPELPHHFFKIEEIKKLLKKFQILYLKEHSAPVSEKGYDNILYYYVIARKISQLAEPLKKN